MLKDDAHQVYRNRNYLPDVFEIDRLALLENNLVLVFEVNETNFKPGVTMTICHLTEEYEMVVANGVFGSVDGLDNVYNAGHSGDSVENYPVANDCRQQNWRHLFHIQSILTRANTTAQKLATVRDSGAAFEHFQQPVKFAGFHNVAVLSIRIPAGSDLPSIFSKGSNCGVGKVRVAFSELWPRALR